MLVKNPDMKRLFTPLILMLVMVPASFGDAMDDLREDRTAVEHVYYSHRLGEKPPFEKALPPSLIEELVRDHLHKETVLRQVYSVEITAALLETEVQRITTTTQAPEMLAEIQSVLGNDPVKFANVFAKPFLVERLLRNRFENDDVLHANLRQEVAVVRERLLAARSEGKSGDSLLPLFREDHTEQISETTWELGVRPENEVITPTAEEIEIRKRFGADALILSSPAVGNEDRKFYFADLHPELQNVLRAQLNRAGDISAVIEMPTGFLLYLTQEKTPETLSVVVFTLPKLDFNQWLEDQTENE